MDVLSPLEQSVLEWNNCDDKSVDNFDPSLMTDHENGDFLNDQTFHTPSFGDEEFDIPPINLPPTSEDEANSSDLYGSTQPLSHQLHLVNSQLQQKHMLPPSPPLSQHSPQGPPTCTQALTDLGPLVMTPVTSSPPVTNYVNIGQQNQHFVNNQVLPSQQQQQHQQQQQQQQPDLYMLQLADRSMMPPQSVQYQVQQFEIPTTFPNGPSGHVQQRMDQQQQQIQFAGHQMGIVPQQMHHFPQHHLHQQQQQQQHHHHQSMMSPSSMFALQFQGPPRQRPGSVGSSPPGSNHTSPGLETSEDSDDSGHITLLMGGIKRPSPEPSERPPSGGKPKKPKTQKKKKKRDPNEPQKPVSAYALFFRDTQAAIKGQNPNASFGEVSKIVASMWDGLDIDHKNLYKRKTEAAKKEYLKALAAYRASLVSKAGNDPSDNIYGSGATTGPPTPVTSTSSSPMSTTGGGGAPSALQKKSPLLTSLMEGTSPINSLHNMTQPQPLLMGQNMPHPQMLPQHMQQQQQQHAVGGPPHQILQHILSPGPMNHMMGHHQLGNHPGPPQRNGQMNGNNNANNNNISYSAIMMGTSNQLPHPGNQMQPQGNMMCSPPPQLQNCLRNGGDQHLQQQQQQQQAQQQENWESREFCNNDCVVSHCRDVYSTWVASRPPPPNSYASVK